LLSASARRGRRCTLSPVALSASVIAGQSGYTAEVNRIACPSGDQRRYRLRSRWPSLLRIAGSRRWAGSKSASQTCCESDGPLRKRIRLPSGANCTPESPACATASFCGSPPLIACTQSSAVFVFWSRLTVVTAVGQPLAVRGDGGFAQPLHLHQVRQKSSAAWAGRYRTGRERRRERRRERGVSAHGVFLVRAEEAIDCARRKSVTPQPVAQFFLRHLQIISSLWRTMDLETVERLEIGSPTVP